MMMETASSRGNSLRLRTDGPIPSAGKVFAILFLAACFLLARRMRSKSRALEEWVAVEFKNAAPAITSSGQVDQDPASG